MAATKLTDINMFEKATKEIFGKLNITSNILESGVTKGDSELKRLMSGKGTGTAILMPFIKRTAALAFSSGSDSAGEIVDQNIESGSGFVYTTYRNISVGVASIINTVEKEGISMSEAATKAIADSRQKMLEDKATAILTGVVAAALAGGLDVVNDIGATVVNFNAFSDTEAKNYAGTEYVLLNKKTLAALKRDKGAVYLPKDNAVKNSFATIDDKKIIISKNIVDGDVVLIEKGTLISEEIDAANGTFKYVVNEKANNGSGSESFLYRSVNAMTIDQFSFTGSPVDKFNVSDAELADGANWTFIGATEDECPFVVLRGAIA